VTERLVTDMNQRERERFIGAFGQIRDSATAIMEALEAGDDTALIGPSLIFTMSILGVQDLFKVLASAQAVDTSDLDKPFGFGPDDGSDGG